MSQLLSPKEKQYLRSLAVKLAEVASKPEQAEKRKLWYDHNELRHTRPVILCDPEHGWYEIITNDSYICESELGKKWYPDYDLIFLGALSYQGFKIRLGKIEGNNALIAIAPSDEDVERLYSVGLSMLSDDQRNILMKAENELQIARQLLVK